MKKYIHLSLLLFFIAAFSGLILSAANDMTKEQIAKVQASKVNTGITELFKDAKENTIIASTLVSNYPKPAAGYDAVLEIREVFSDTNKTNSLGYVFIIKAPGSYSKNLQVMIGVNNEGKIVGNEYLNMTETPGVGSKVATDRFQWFNDQFKNLTEITRDNKGNATNVDIVSGASYTSKSVINSVDLALKYYNANLKK